MKHFLAYLAQNYIYYKQNGSVKQNLNNLLLKKNKKCIYQILIQLTYNIFYVLKFNN